MRSLKGRRYCYDWYVTSFSKARRVLEDIFDCSDIFLCLDSSRNYCSIISSAFSDLYQPSLDDRLELRL